MYQLGQFSNGSPQINTSQSTGAKLYKENEDLLSHLQI